MNEWIQDHRGFFLLNRICIFLLFLSPHRLRNTIWFPQLSPSAWSSKWPGDLPAAHCWASQHGDRCPGAAGRRSHQSPEKVLATPFQGTCFGTLIWSGDMPHRLGACKGHPWSSKAFVALPQHAWSQRSLALWTELPKFPQKFQRKQNELNPLTFSFQNWKSIVLAKCQWVLWVGTIRQFRCPFFQPLCCRCKPPAKAFLCNHIVENEGSHSKVVDCTLKFLLDARIHVGVELDYGFRLCLPYLEGTANRCLGFPILTRMGEREGLHYCTWSDELNNIQKTFSNRSGILKSNKIEVTYLSPCASKCCCGSSSPVLLHCWSTRIWRSRLKQWAARLCKLCIVNPDVMVLSACNSLNTIFANQKY